MSYKISIHHRSMCFLMEAISRRERYAFSLGRLDERDFMIRGVPVRTDWQLKPFGYELSKWEFPKERFVTYEKSDEAWCRFFGIGRSIPSKAITGDIVIIKEVPMLALPPGASAVIRREPELLFDREYVDACRAAEMIQYLITDFIQRAIDKHEDSATACRLGR